MTDFLKKIPDFITWLDSYTQAIEDGTGLLIFLAILGVIGYCCYLMVKKGLGI